MDNKKKVLVLNGNPKENSYCASLAKTWAEAARARGHEVDQIDIRDLAFAPNRHSSLEQDSDSLEPDLLAAQEAIRKADHLVLVYPNWWGTMPALLKGFIDRVLVPGFAFRYRKGSPFPQQLLAGKTASLIVSMDGPGWWYRLMMGDGGTRAMVRSTLAFCGVKTTRIHYADNLRGKGEAPALRHLASMKKLGALAG